MPALKYKDPNTNAWVMMPIQGTPGPQGPPGEGGTDEVWIGPDEPGHDGVEIWYDTDAEPLEGEVQGVTTDTGEAVKLLFFSDGTVRAVPVDAEAPPQPTGLARTIRVSFVRLSWTATAGAVTYQVLRDDVVIATVTTLTYRDLSVVVGTTYSYTVRAVSAYNLISVPSAAVTAFVDPALNVAPELVVTTWPATTLLANQQAIVRLNVIDEDLQVLANTLGVDVGTLVATTDPTVYRYLP